MQLTIRVIKGNPWTFSYVSPDFQRTLPDIDIATSTIGAQAAALSNPPATLHSNTEYPLVANVTDNQVRALVAKVKAVLAAKEAAALPDDPGEYESFTFNTRT